MTKSSCGILSLLTILLLSCSRNNSLNKLEYINFFGGGAKQFTKERHLNGLSYKLKMQLPEYTLLKCNDSLKSIHEFEREVEKEKDKITFVFLFSDDQKSKKVKEIIYQPEMFGRLIDYANTELAADFKLVQDADTIPCSLVHLEPANSLQPVIRLSLAFGKLKRSSHCTVIYNDNVFNNGEIRFHFGEETFTNLPKLIL